MVEQGRMIVIPQSPARRACGDLSCGHGKISIKSPKFADVTLLMGVLAMLSLTGCVRRRLTVRTNPPGAVVSVDNQNIGTSPAASSFVYYGTRELRIEKDGYRTETILRTLDPPWYEYPVIEFISESLWPWEIRDERVIDVELVPKQVQPMEQVVSRADQLRGQARSGIVTGSVATPIEPLDVPPATIPIPPPAPAPPPTGLPPGGIQAIVNP